MSAPARSFFTSSLRVASKAAWRRPAQSLFQKCPECRQISRTAVRRNGPQPVDDPAFKSLLDNPPVLVRVGGGKRHGPGLIILALIPIIAFGLGTWQVQRLTWKSELIARLEDRLVRDPLPLPGRIDPESVKDFDYRRVYATGHLRHDQEMLIGPRMMEGKDGYLVVTPLEREGEGTTVLVSRGWIDKQHKDQKSRPEGLPQGEVTVEGLLREPWKKNMFTPDNNLAKGEFYFPDVAQMAERTGSQAVWVEETMQPDLIVSWDREAKGVPIGRPAEVNLRNNHAQYIFTWYALSAATSVMLWMVVKKPPTDLARKVRHNKDWS